MQGTKPSDHLGAQELGGEEIQPWVAWMGGGLGATPTACWTRGLLRGPSQAKAVMEATGLRAQVSSSTPFSVFIHLFIEAFIEHLLYARPAEHSG